VNAERFLTKELQRFEEKVLSAADRSQALEYDMFTHLREQVAAQADRTANGRSPRDTRRSLRTG